MFTYKRKAQYHETDQMGVIHHANYVKWMEEARVEFMDNIGLGYDEVEKRGVISPVTGVSLDYKKQVQFADEVEIRLEIGKYNGVVLEIEYEFYNITKQEICTKASSKHCFIKDGRIISLKKELKDLDVLITSSLANPESNGNNQ